MEEDGLLTQGMPQWKKLLENDQESLGDLFSWNNSYIGLALLSGVEGNARESQRLIKRWFLQERIDWAERIATRHNACRVLGMITAAQAAVKCLRDGLLEPSVVIPFFEPYLPFYDSLRDKPEFIEMLADIDGGSYANNDGGELEVTSD